MKRTFLALAVLLCLAGVVTLGWAQEAQQAAANQTSSETSDDPLCPVMDKGTGMGHMGDKAMMKMGMMKMMRPPIQMVASNDGGAIVLVGNKLLKYDKNLNVVKEAEIKGGKADMEAMCKMMGKKCVDDDAGVAKEGPMPPAGK